MLLLTACQGVSFEHGHMLVGCGMEDYLGCMAPHHPVNQCLILNIPQHRGIALVPGPMLQLHLHLVQGRLTGIQQNQLPGLKLDDLAAQFTADAAPAGPGDP